MPHDPATYATRTFRAILLIVAAYFAYSVADLCAKILQERYSVYQVLGMSGIIGLSITSIWLFTAHGPRAFLPPRLRLHLIRAFFSAGTSYFGIRALATLPLADFYGIVFSMPFIVMILAVLLLDEKVGWRRWLATAVGFSGVLIIAGPQFHHIGEGVICAMIGAVCGASNIICLRKIGKDQPLPLYGFYPFLFITISQIAGLIITDSYVPFRMEDMKLFFIHGPVILTAIILVSMGFSRAPETAVVAPFHYTQIIWGVAFGWMFFHVLPSSTTAIGIALVTGAGLYSIWREYRRKHMV